MSVDLIIGGASKSGTTALYDMLRSSPAFFLPQRKELHYFSRPFLMNTVAGRGDEAVVSEIPETLDAYLHHFANKQNDQVSVDISPSYLFHYRSAATIAHDLPGVKVVFILRRPEDKVFSQYLHLVGEGRETLSFDEALSTESARKSAGYSDMWLYGESGFYADSIAAFQSALSVERVKVVLFEDFCRSPSAVLADICRFAGLDGTQSFDTDLQVNVSGAPRSILLARAMAPNRFTNLLRRFLPMRLGQAARRTLRSFNTGTKRELSGPARAKLRLRYVADIKQLEKLIGHETGWLGKRN